MGELILSLAEIEINFSILSHHHHSTTNSFSKTVSHPLNTPGVFCSERERTKKACRLEGGLTYSVLRLPVMCCTKQCKFFFFFSRCMFLVIAYSDDLVEPKLPRKKLSISIFFDKPVSCVCVCGWPLWKQKITIKPLFHEWINRNPLLTKFAPTKSQIVSHKSRITISIFNE